MAVHGTHTVRGKVRERELQYERRRALSIMQVEETRKPNEAREIQAVHLIDRGSRILIAYSTFGVR